MANIFSPIRQSSQTIKELYAAQWLLIAEPELLPMQAAPSLLARLVSGIVLFASEDKREVARRAQELTPPYQEVICIFSSETQRKRLFLL